MRDEGREGRGEERRGREGKREKEGGREGRGGEGRGRKGRGGDGEGRGREGRGGGAAGAELPALYYVDRRGPASAGTDMACHSRQRRRRAD